MHKCDKCKKVSHIITGRISANWCGDCFSKYYKVQKGIKSKLNIYDKDFQSKNIG